MESKSTLFPASLKAGLYVGLAGIVVFILEYVADIKPVGIMRPILIMLFGFAVTITMLVILLKNYRTKIGGYISFGNAFLFCFIAFFVSSLISLIFTYAFFNFFDPLYMQHVLEAQKEYMSDYLSGRVSDEQVSQSLDKIDAQIANANSIGTILKSISFGLIFGFIISLILGAIMKRNPTAFDNSSSGGVI